jgi:hypothetical protein
VIKEDEMDWLCSRDVSYEKFAHSYSLEAFEAKMDLGIERFQDVNFICLA